MTAPEMVGAVFKIPVHDLRHGPNARGELGDVTELANSMRKLGQQVPLIVEPSEGGKWSVFDGNRRLKAGRTLNFAHMLAITRSSVMDDQTRVVRQLAMHGAARSFDPIAEAKGIEWLMFDAPNPMTREQIAEALGKHPSWVKGRVDLLQLQEHEQRSVAAGVLSVREAQHLVSSRRAGGPPEPKVRIGGAGGCNVRCKCRCHERNREAS